jgi:hypothetical protein
VAFVYYVLNQILCDTHVVLFYSFITFHFIRRHYASNMQKS